MCDGGLDEGRPKEVAEDVGGCGRFEERQGTQSIKEAKVWLSYAGWHAKREGRNYLRSIKQVMRG